MPRLAAPGLRKWPTQNRYLSLTSGAFLGAMLLLIACSLQSPSPNSTRIEPAMPIAAVIPEATGAPPAATPAWAAPTATPGTGSANSGPTRTSTQTATPTEARTVRTAQFGDLDIITLLPYDAISAILEPKFISGDEARKQYSANERVIGVSINGDHRAYSIRQLSSREIVNDVVGGLPVVVTW